MELLFLLFLAEKRGAKNLDAIDIDPWCVENSQENISRNKCNFITVSLGDATKIPKDKYHTVIANINRNILLNDMGVYKESLLAGGTLFLEWVLHPRFTCYKTGLQQIRFYICWKQRA